MNQRTRSHFWHIGRVHFGWSRSVPTNTLNLVIHVSQKDKLAYPVNARSRFELEFSVTSKNPPNREPGRRYEP